MKFNHLIKTLIVIVTTTYSVLVFAQAQPQPNGHALGSTTGAGSVSATQSNTNSTATGTTGGMGADPDQGVTALPPMDPSRDTRTNNDPMLDSQRDRRAAASGTVTPEPKQYPQY